MKHKEDVRPDSLNRSGKTDRVPIHGGKNILTVEGQEPGFHYCWVTNDNTPKYERASYEFVTHSVIVGDRRIDAAPGIGTKISIPGGNGVTLYLMRIPTEFYEADMAALHKNVDEMEATMFENEGSAPGRYGKVGRERLS